MNAGTKLTRIFKLWGLALCIGLFVVLALSAEVWPAKKFYFFTEAKGMEVFFRLDNLNFRAPLPGATSTMHYESLPYLLLLKMVRYLISDRLMCMRLVSIFAGIVILICIYLICKLLFSRTVALVALYFLVTNPAFLETARAYGYHSLSHMVAILAILFAIISGRQRFWWWWVSFSAFACCLLLYLYAPLRMATIPLVVVWYVLSGKGWWQKTLLFCGIFGILVIAIGVSQQEKASLISQVLITKFSHEYASANDKVVDINRFLEHLTRNFPILLGYLLNLKRTAFASYVKTSRILAAIYVPFWIIGLVICGFSRRREHIIVLLMLDFFVLPLLPAKALPPRRIIIVLYPLALAIGLGVTSVYSYLIRVLSGKPWSRLAPTILVAFLLAAGLFDIRHYIFELSRPQYEVSSENLSKIANFILERAGEDPFVILYDCAPYVWGNKYLSNRINRYLMSMEYTLPIEEYIRISMIVVMNEHRPLRVLFHNPPPKGLARAITWAKGHFPESSLSFQISDTEFYVFYFMPPPSISPNLLFSEGPELRLSAGGTGSKETVLNNFIDGDASSWVEISPSRDGETPQVLFDFGSDNERIPRVILAVPADYPPRPELFIQKAVVSASSDGDVWETLRKIKGEKSPRVGTWCQWTLPGERPYRYYRVEFYGDDGRPAQSTVLGDLGLYESQRNIFQGIWN